MATPKTFCSEAPPPLRRLFAYLLQLRRRFRAMGGPGIGPCEQTAISVHRPIILKCIAIGIANEVCPFYHSVRDLSRQPNGSGAENISGGLVAVVDDHGKHGVWSKGADEVARDGRRRSAEAARDQRQQNAEPLAHARLLCIG